MARPNKIGVIADYNPQNQTHQATQAALEHAGTELGIKVQVSWLQTAGLEAAGSNLAALLEVMDGLMAGPGSPYKGPEGALAAIRWARENNRPFFAT